jgi:hypothetical protein
LTASEPIQSKAKPANPSYFAPLGFGPAAFLDVTVASTKSEDGERTYSIKA